VGSPSAAPASPDASSASIGSAAPSSASIGSNPAPPIESGEDILGVLLDGSTRLPLAERLGRRDGPADAFDDMVTLEGLCQARSYLH
jgi:hypothetical protein